MLNLAAEISFRAGTHKATLAAVVTECLCSMIIKGLLKPEVIGSRYKINQSYHAKEKENNNERLD